MLSLAQAVPLSRMLPVPRVLLVGAGQMIFALIDWLREQDCLPADRRGAAVPAMLSAAGLEVIAWMVYRP